MQDSVELIIKEYLILGTTFGISLGFLVWFSSWCVSQVIHLFKAITR